MRKMLITCAVALGLFTSGVSAATLPNSEMPAPTPEITNNILQIPSYLVCFAKLPEPVNGSSVIIVRSQMIVNIDVDKKLGTFDIFGFDILFAENENSTSVNEEISYNKDKVTGSFVNMSNTSNVVSMKFDDGNTVVDINSAFNKDKGTANIDIKNVGDTNLTVTLDGECTLFAATQ